MHLGKDTHNGNYQEYYFSKMLTYIQKWIVLHNEDNKFQNIHILKGMTAILTVLLHDINIK